MAEPTIDDISSRFDEILQLTGENSYVNWETFTKSSTQFTKTLEELAKQIAVLRQIQQKKFINAMKKLKAADVPDMVKTVKAKKLPPQALKAIANRFTLNEGKISLKNSVEELKGQAQSIFDEYINGNEAAAAKAKETVEFLSEKIKLTGLYEEPENKELVSTFKHHFEESKLEAAKKTVEVKHLPNTVDTIHITTYAQIVEGTFEVVKDEYRRLTQEARQKQRAIVKDTPKYLEALTQYLTNTEVLILDGQKAIAEKIGVSAQKLEEAEGTLMERGLGQNILFLQSGLRTKVKQSIVAEKPVSLERAKEILKYQVGLLSSRTEYFKELFGNMDKNQENLQLVPMILALALNDMVFEEYSLEEEDIMKNVTDQMIMTNPEFSELFRDLEVKIIKLMEQIGAIPEQISQYMQNQSSGPITGPGVNMPLPGGNPLGGMLPGSNPMDLLQFQQFMQMQQMQQQMQQQPPAKK